MSILSRMCAVVALVLSVGGLTFFVVPPVKAAKPPKNVRRPILYFSASGEASWAIRRTDEAGTSDIAVKSGGTLRYGGRPRWSPNGLFIGGHHAQVGSDLGIMVMNGDGTNEQVVVTDAEFNAWNLSRSGVRSSLFLQRDNENCWLGTDAILFPAYTEYDATLYGGDRELTVEGRALFIADFSTGAIAPLTESAHFGGDSFSHTDPHWSAALDKVVFVGTHNASLQMGAVNELYAINPDGTGLQQITAFGTSARLYAPVWSPSGDRLAVTVRPPGTGSRDLWILTVDLGQPNPGTGLEGRVTAMEPLKLDASAEGNQPVWSARAPDGRRVIYNRTVWDNPSRTHDELMMIDSFTGAEAIVRSGRYIEMPDWSPVA